MSIITNDLEQIMQAAKAAVSEKHDAIAELSRGLLPDLKQLINPAIFAEVYAT